MTWIRTIPLPEADAKLRQAMEDQKSLYPKEYATPVHPVEGGGSEIVASHSLIPEALYHAFATFGVLMSPDLPLARRQHEMIGSASSAIAACQPLAGGKLIQPDFNRVAAWRQVARQINQVRVDDPAP